MIRLAVRVQRTAAEIVLAELLELVPGGLEESDVSEDVVEYALYGAAGELPDLPALEAAAGDTLVEVTTSEVPDDWADRWKAWHRPVDVAWRFRRLRVRPPWEEALPDDAEASAGEGSAGEASAGEASAGDEAPGRGREAPGRGREGPGRGREGPGRGRDAPGRGMKASGRDRLDLVIDPGQAFGTGAHHTTRLCLELLLELDPGGALADWGAGSGVLAIAAARLGYRPVLAVDVDPASLEASAENARVNGAEVEVQRMNLRREPAPWAPTATANLVRPLLLDVARLLERAPERLIASGLLRAEADEVAAAFAAHGLEERDRRCGGEWAAVLLAR